MPWKLVSRIGLGLLALVLVAVLAVGAVGWSWVRKPLPQTAGELTLTGLTGPVTVIRDDRGVPQIYADNPADLFRAQGYVHAQDRFFEMDLRRHVTAGRLAELVGPSGFDTDRMLRTLGWRRVAEQELPLLSSQTRQYLQAYADGVNAYLHQAGNPSQVSVEYSLLDLSYPSPTIEDWTPLDSLSWLKAMAWDLRSDYDGELVRAQLAGSMTPKHIAEIFPRYPYDTNAPILSTQDWSSATTAAKSALPSALSNSTPLTGDAPASPADAAGGTDIPVGGKDPAAASAYAAARAALNQVPTLIGRGDGVGSNSWVVSGERSTTGKPILANDPHLSTSLPGIWYQVGLHCRSVSTSCPFDVAGFSFSGLPGVIIGHNNHIAWGLTNLGPDVTDFYLEKVQGNSSLKDGSWTDMEVRTETIKVAGQKDRTIVVRSTRHGPLLSDVSPAVHGIGTTAPVGGEAHTETYAVSLAWTGLVPSPTADAIFAIDSATDFTQFRAAAEKFASPSQNLLYADTAGHIGYQAPGLVPKRAPATVNAPAGYWPAPGWSSSYDWTGWVPFDQMPYALDPAEGFLVAANQAVTASARPFLTTEWDMGYRSQRIRDVLSANDVVSPDDMATLQADTSDGFAPTLVKALLAVDVDDPFAAEAQSLLKDWDYTSPAGKSADGAAAAYYYAVWSNLLALTFDDEMGGLTAGGGSRWMQAMSTMLANPKSTWWDNKQTPSVAESRDEILRQAMVRARLELTERIGKDPMSWKWGDVHTVTVTGALNSGMPGLLQRLFTVGPAPVPGSSSVVNAMAWDAAEGYHVTHAPSMRMVVNLADLDASRWVNQTGQSGHPTSAHYGDQFDAWRSGETYGWPFTGAAVQSAGVETLQLTS
ncbi:MAG: penicillin acylase family protein [Nostocoides sp.]